MTPCEALVVVLRGNPDMRATLLVQHRPDADGRCRRCRGGGDSSGTTLGCSLYAAAVRAGREVGA